MRARGRPAALQPRVVHIKKRPAVDVIRVRSADEVERSAGSRRLVNPEPAIRRDRPQERRQRAARISNYGTDVEEPVLLGARFVEPHHDVRRQRHRVIQKRDRRHVRFAQKCVQRNVAGAELRTPVRRQSRIRSSAEPLDGRGDLRDRVGFVRRRGEILAAPDVPFIQILPPLRRRNRQQHDRHRGRCERGHRPAAAERHRPELRQSDSRQDEQEPLRAADEPMHLRRFAEPERFEQWSPRRASAEEKNPEQRTVYREQPQNR